MGKIFLAPRSNETAYKNYVSSMQGIPKSVLEKHFKNTDKIALRNIDVIHAWGCQPSLKSRWDKMRHGDFILFYSHGRFISVGEFIFKKRSEALALALWPRSKETNEPWTLVFFVDNLVPIDLSLEDFNEITGYNLTAVMGFMPVINGQENLNKRFGSTKGFIESLKTGLQLSKIDELADISSISLSIKSKEKLAKFDELTRGKSDQAIEEALKNHAEAAAGESPEKVTKFVRTYKRNRKLVDDIKAKYKNKCQICEFTFKTSGGKYYSEAAHIIPIASGEKGVDSPDNIWVLCANHHKMLDLGAIQATGPDQYRENGEFKRLLAN